MNIQTNITNNKEPIYMIIDEDFKSLELMQELELEYIILKDTTVFNTFDKRTKQAFKTIFKHKELILLSTKENQFKELLISIKQVFKTSSIKISFCDIEVLKAMELIPEKELKLNDYPIGLTLLNGDDFYSYIQEIKSEQRQGNKSLKNYIKELLISYFESSNK